MKPSQNSTIKSLQGQTVISAIKKDLLKSILCSKRILNLCYPKHLVWFGATGAQHLKKIVPVKNTGEGDSASFITRLNGTQEKINSAARQLNFILVHDQNIFDCYFYHRAQIWIIFSGLDLTKCLINNTLTHFNLLELCIIL